MSSIRRRIRAGHWREIIGTAFYHAFGYNTVDVYLAELDADRLVIAPSATPVRSAPRRTQKTDRRDLDNVLRRAARQADGKYRVLVSRFADGKPLGNFRYYGTRPDDPNDIVPHEHRRELRAARVFGAWLNHDDSRGVEQPRHARHRTESQLHQALHVRLRIDHGSGTVYATPSSRQQVHPGVETGMADARDARAVRATLDPDLVSGASLGQGDSKPLLQPELWKPEYPNAAFENMRPDDAFWAARIVAQFDADIVRALVEKAHYSDPNTTNI